MGSKIQEKGPEALISRTVIFRSFSWAGKSGKKDPKLQFPGPNYFPALSRVWKIQEKIPDFAAWLIVVLQPNFNTRTMLHILLR